MVSGVKVLGVLAFSVLRFSPVDSWALIFSSAPLEPMTVLPANFIEIGQVVSPPGQVEVFYGQDR